MNSARATDNNPIKAVVTEAFTRMGDRVRSFVPLRSDSPGATGWQRLSERLPLALVLATVVFNLVVLRAEIHPAAFLNDTSQHIQMVRWATRQFAEHRIPFDGWYRYFALGSPNFHQYHTLPHIITAYFAQFFGVNTTFNMSLYLLLSTWPISIYTAVRIWGWNDRWTAACAAIISPLIVSTPGYGFEHGSYIWRGYGVWPQLWGMWLLPLAWALGYRAVKEKRRYGRAALVIALTIACHLILGYLALLAIGIWVLVERADFLRRLGRGALVGFGAVLGGSWVLVPLLSDRDYTTKSIFYVHNLFADSFGAKKVLGWLFTGGLFDSARLPYVTVLVFAGIIVCIRRWRTDDRARALLGVWGFSMLLFFGRPTLGPLMKLLPGNQDLQIHRFIAGVHLGGIILAGVGAVAIGRLLRTGVQRLLRTPHEVVVVVLVAAVGVAWISPAFVDRVRYDRWGAQLIAYQKGADATDGADLAALVAIANQRGNGRIYGGMRARQDYKVGQVPVYAEIANNDGDDIGFIFRTIASMSTDVEAEFNERNPVHYEIYDVSYILLPRGQTPYVPATLIDTRGRHALWLTRTNSYLDVVDTTAPIYADRSNLVTQVAGWLGSSAAAQKLYPTIGFAGHDPAPPTTVQGERRNGLPGRVLSEMDDLQDGVMSGEVYAQRKSVVVLKSSYHPRWRVAVDSVPQPTEMIAPSYVGVTIPAGRHRVFFYYATFSGYPKLFLLGFLTLIGLALVPTVTRRRARSHRIRPPPSLDLTKAKAWLNDVRRSPNFVPTIIAALVAFFVYELSVEKTHQFYNTYVWLSDAFLHGHLDVAHPPPFIEFVTINGRHYSHQAPLPGILLMPFVAIWGIGFELRQFAVLEGTAIAAAVWSLATRLGLRGWRRVGAWAFPVLGTTVWYEAKTGHTWSVAALCSVLFLFLALNEYFGPRRLWLVGLLVGCAGLSRPAAFLAMIGFAVAVRGEPKKVISLAKGAIGPFAVMLGYNYVRFGTISDKALETYYESDYYRTLRPPGLFNAKNLPWNLYSWFLLRPHLQSQFPWFKLQFWGNSLPFTSPAFFAAFWARRDRWLWVCGTVVLIPAALFYANGYVQFGIRYLLDAIPFLSALIFICVRDRRARWYWPLLALSIAINAYGVAYTTVFPLRFGQ